MKRVLFVTDNAENLRQVKRYLDQKTISVIQTSGKTLNSIDNNLQDIVAKKILTAYQKLQEPCFLVESSFMIEALHQFPGIMLDYTLQTIGIDGLLKLMSDQENRHCVYHQVLGYYDGNEIHYFYSDIKGTLATKKAGDPDGNLLEQIFIPESYQRLLESSTVKPAYQPDCIEQFAHYLNHHYTNLIDDYYHEN